MAEWDNRILNAWAERLGVDAHHFNTRGFRVQATHPETYQVYWCAIGEMHIAGIPKRFASALAQTGAQTLDNFAAVAAWLNSPLHFECRDFTYYASEALTNPFAVSHIRALSAADSALLHDLKSACTESELEMSSVSLEDAMVFGCLHEGRLVGAASMLDWGGGIYDVGVLTHPAYRGQHIGAALVTALSNAAMAQGYVVQYRADERNIGSWRLAEKCGFRRFSVMEEYTLHAD